MDLGDFYDARSHNFLSRSLLRSEPPLAACTSSSVPSSSVRLIQEFKRERMFQELNIGPDLGATIESGMIKVDDCSGVARCLNEISTIDNLERGFLYYNINTIEERLSFGSPELRPYLSLDSIRGSGATHVLADITWGSRTMVVVQASMINDTDRLSARQCNDTILQNLEGCVLNGIGGLNQTSGLPDKSREAFFSIYSDTLPEAGHDRTVQGVSNFLLSLPQRTAAMSEGQGTQVAYTLLPLEFLSYALNTDIRADAMYVHPDAISLKELIALNDQVRDITLKLDAYLTDLQTQKHCVPSSHIEAVSQTKRSLAASESSLQSRGGRLLHEVRGGFADQLTLSQFLLELRKTLLSHKDVDALMLQFRDKMAFAKNTMALGITYWGYGAVPIEHELQRNNIGDAYVLYFTESIRHQSAAWEASHKLLMQLFDRSSQHCVFVVVDCDALGQKLDDVRISRFQRGTMTIPDVLHQVEFGQCFAQCIRQEDLIRGNAEKPMRRSVVAIACPGRNCSRDITYEWRCSVCDVYIEYSAVDQNLYCECGRTAYHNYAFKCKDLEHGVDHFERYDKRTLA